MNWLIQKIKYSPIFVINFVPWINALYKMWCKQFITHIILVCAEGMWDLVALSYHNTQ